MMLQEKPPLSLWKRCQSLKVSSIKVIQLLFVFLFFSAYWVSAQEKPRIFVLTDIENEPDDAMSMVRFLVYANHYDVEGLAATTSIHQQNKVATYRIREIVDAYSKVRDNLEKHEPGFPKGDYLRSCITEGLPIYGMNAVGEGKDSPASELLIKAVDKEDPRPLWVTAWGGPNVLAQALWKVRQTRSREAVQKFVSKLRVYTISDQDDSGPWMRKEFPELFYIVSPGFSSGGGYHQATWSGISGDFFHARCDGADYSLVTNEWLDRNIRRKGPLGAEYPHWEYLMEGDTPSFMFLFNNGLNNPEHPDWGGWGGRYELYTPRMRKWHLYPESRPIWANAEDEVLGVDSKWHEGNHETIWRWREAYQNDFAARMDWTISGEYGKANHPPVPKIDHETRMVAKKGEKVMLSAKGSSDPDGDALSYQWFYYKEAGSFPLSSARSGQPLEIHNFDQPEAWFIVPERRVMPPGTGTIHIILAVTDHGSPRLTRYQRVIVSVQGDESSVGWNQALKQYPEWYSSIEAIRIADNLLVYQHKTGGWPKNIDMARMLSPEEMEKIKREKGESGTVLSRATIDNGATSTQVRYLAKVYDRTRLERFKKSFLKGVDYLLAAQYDNGGWPQYYPIRKGYYENITYNDDAIVNTMRFLQDLYSGNEAFVSLQIDKELKEKVEKAFNKGVQCILNTQIYIDGKPTVWCAQHDRYTLVPAKARSYELESLSGSESAGIVQLLMSIDNPSKEIKAAVNGAVEWFENNKIEGIKVEEITNKNGQKDRVVVEDKNAPPLWGRFYDLETSEPFFCSRDGIKKSSLAEISYNRRNGYRWYINSPEKVLKIFPEWKKRLTQNR